MHRKGFTLVETVISVAVLAVMYVMVAGIFTSASSKTTNNLGSAKQKELVVADLETVIAFGVSAASQELTQESGSVIIDFGTKKIRSDGVYLTGFYGEEQLPLIYFHSGG